MERISSGFHYLKKLPQRLENLINTQTWPNIIKVDGLKEGVGIFASKDIPKNTAICNYGGDFLSSEVADKYIIPFPNLCIYLLEIVAMYNGEVKKFYLNHCSNTKTKSLGMFINHSKLHPNLFLREFVTFRNEVDVIFYASRKIYSGEQLVWNYGSAYQGVQPCVQSCWRCCKKNPENTHNI